MTRKRSLRSHGWWICLLLLACALSGAAQEASPSRKILKKVEAQYPATLKRLGIGGTVRLKVYIKPDGTVRETEVQGGSPALADSAQKAVMQWRFAAAEAETVMQVSIVFDPNAQ
jgi:TonB family protein